jgi:hypothetical protein
LGGLHACGATFPYIVPLPNSFLTRLFSKTRLKRKDFQEILRLPWAQEVPSSNLGAPTKSISRVFFYLLKTPFTSDPICSYAGSFTLKTLIAFPSIEMVSSVCVILCGRLPRIESYFSRCAGVFESVMSFTARFADHFLCVYTAAVVPTLSGSPQWDCLRVSKR